MKEVDEMMKKYAEPSSHYVENDEATNFEKVAEVRKNMLESKAKIEVGVKLLATIEEYEEFIEKCKKSLQKLSENDITITHMEKYISIHINGEIFNIDKSQLNFR